jgi:hypothetical protein
MDNDGADQSNLLGALYDDINLEFLDGLDLDFEEYIIDNQQGLIQ